MSGQVQCVLLHLLCTIWTISVLFLYGERKQRWVVRLCQLIFVVTLWLVAENTVKVTILTFSFLYIHFKAKLLTQKKVAEQPILQLIVSSSTCIDPCWNTAVMRSIWTNQRNEVTSGVVDENDGSTSRFWAPILSSCLHTSAPADESSWRLYPAGSDKSANWPSSLLGPSTKTMAVVV